MTTDTSERGLEKLICTALAGSSCDPRAEPMETVTWTDAAATSVFGAVTRVRVRDAEVRGTFSGGWPLTTRKVAKLGVSSFSRVKAKIRKPSARRHQPVHSYVLGFHQRPDLALGMMECRLTNKLVNVASRNRSVFSRCSMGASNR